VTHTIINTLPREVDPAVFHISAEDPGDVSYADVSGFEGQLNEICEVIELPLKNPAIFRRRRAPCFMARRAQAKL
jgi:26S proteasome regulatory subunit T4